MTGPNTLQPGDVAPAFDLPAFPEGRVRLRQFKGKNKKKHGKKGKGKNKGKSKTLILRPAS